MDPSKTKVSSLEALPQDILGAIVSKISATYPKAYHNCLSSCKRLGASANDERICKNLNLAPLVKKPLSAIKYLRVMKRCLGYNNPNAHYIKGIIRYFLLEHSTVGLYHLRVVADAGKKDAIYLSGILLLCLDRVEEGKNYINQLKWEDDTGVVKACWGSIKRSLHGIRVTRKAAYLESLQKMKPSNYCHLKDLDITCPDCFYYKMMKRFIFMI